MTHHSGDSDLGPPMHLQKPPRGTRTTPSLTSGGAATFDGGELLGRFGHPVGPHPDASDIPRESARFLRRKISSCFRDRRRPNAGFWTRDAAIGGTPLYYGKGEDDGIRCCYHGWKFEHSRGTV